MTSCSDDGTTKGPAGKSSSGLCRFRAVREVLRDAAVAVDARDAPWQGRRMRTFHYNGEYWYERNDGVIERVLDWLAWSGPLYAFIRGTPGAPRTLREALADPTPVSLFGHRVTFQWFGVDVRTRWGFLCLHRDREGNRYAYVSRDGTPQGAHVWLFNPPAAIVREARRAGETMTAFVKRTSTMH